MSLTEEGSRPADRAAAAIRDRISVRREEIDIVRTVRTVRTVRCVRLNDPNDPNDPNVSNDYFLTMLWSAGNCAFTSAAFAPLGSTLRYCSRAATAAAKSPRLSVVIPSW